MALDCRWHFFVNSVTAHSDIDIYFHRCKCRLCQSKVTLINTASKTYDQFRYMLRNNENFMMLKTRNSVSIYLNIKFLQSFVSCIFLLVSNYEIHI